MMPGNTFDKLRIMKATENLKINQAVIIYVNKKKTNAKVKSISSSQNIIDATANGKTYMCIRKGGQWIAQLN